MECPHCSKSIHATWNSRGFGEDREFSFSSKSTTCPACGRRIIKLVKQGMAEAGPGVFLAVDGDLTEVYVHPRAPRRAPIHDTVDPGLAEDYDEACLVIADSPKASAALSRRCLQSLLRSKAGVKHSDLSKEIEEAIEDLPPYLADAIDGVRAIGNFAAHPIKSKETGEVVDVEPGEAEWNLDTLEGLFDHYYAQPAALAAKRAALNAKLKDAGKPELKSAVARSAVSTNGS